MKKIIVISLSAQYIFQETTILMQNYFSNDEHDLYSITSDRQIFKSFVKNENNYFVECPSKPGLSIELFNKTNFNKLVNIILEINPTHILFYSSHTWNIMLMSRLRTDIIYLHVIHDVVPHDNMIKTVLINRYNKQISRKVDKIIVHSLGYLSICKKKYNILENKVSYLPILRKFSSPTPIKSTGKFLFMGRISKYKGIENILHIVKECKNQTFLIVGKFSKDVKKYKKILQSHKNVFIDDNYISEEAMKNYFINTDWVILPYKNASQSGVIPDAYVHSRPVITFNVGNLSEQINNNTGFLIERNNLESFIEHVKKCSNISKMELNEYSNNAYNFGKRNYSFEMNRESFYSLFN